MKWKTKNPPPFHYGGQAKEVRRKKEKFRPQQEFKKYQLFGLKNYSVRVIFFLGSLFK